MASGISGAVVRGVERLFGEGTVAGLGESQLLDRFVSRGDASAFEALVARHGPMVLAVCRRVLGDVHAAEDAFQATFLVLVKKADAIRDVERLGPWLHRVAYRVALRAARGDSRRRAKESPSPEALAQAAAPDRGDRDLALTLHEAIDALPEKYRAAVILCDLEGRTHDEAAQSLRWPVGSVKGRLFRAREILRKRLARRGVTASVGLIAATLAAEAVAAVPLPLVESTLGAALGCAARTGLSAAALGKIAPSSAAVLAEEAARAMKIKTLGTFAATLAALGLVVGGAAVMARQGEDDPKAKRAEDRTQEKPANRPSGAGTPKVASPRVGDPPPTAVVANDGPTGAEAAAELNAQAANFRLRRDELLARVEAADEDMEFLREEIRGLLKLVQDAEMKLGEAEAKATETLRLGGSFTARNRVERLRERLDKARDELKKLRETRLNDRREADDAELAMQSLRTQADEAARRPGKANTVQVGDILVVELLEALPGRPISGERVVRPDGTISLGFYGDLPVAGLTLPEIKAKFIERMQTYVSEEVLGIVGDGPDGKPIAIPPAESDRVFVDNATYYYQAIGRLGGGQATRRAGDDSLERKLDEVLAQMRSARGPDELKNLRPREIPPKEPARKP